MPQDPRQVRTRQALAEALVRVLERSALADITVAELCREAGVHRTTFYGHADSVDDFALAEFSRGIDRLITVDVTPGAETPGNVAARYLGSMRAVFEHVAEDRAGYRALFGAKTRGLFRRALDERVRNRARIALGVWREQGVAGAPADDVTVEEAAAFIAGGLVGLIETWALGESTDADAAVLRSSVLMPKWWPEPE
jgi:AcrR family transcriptional regulator